MKRKYHDEMVDKAYGFTDILLEQEKRPEEEPLTIPTIVIPDGNDNDEPEHKKVRFEDVCQ